MFLKRIHIILFYLFIIHNTLAQGDSALFLNSVEIIRQRPLPERGLTKTEIDSTALEDEINASVSELLAQHSPVFIKTYGQGGLASASFRGTAASHTQVLWNGITLNNPMVGQVDFSLIPVYFLDEVELLHGGSSLEQGSGALGGSVLMNSKAEFKKRTQVTAIQGIGSFSTYNTFLGLKTGTEKWQANVRYFHQESENDFEFTNTASFEQNTQKQKDADYNKDGVLGEVYFDAGKENIVSAHVWYQQANRNIPPIMSYSGAKHEEYQNDYTTRTVVKWKKYWENSTSEFITGYAHSDLDYYSAQLTMPADTVLHFNSENQTDSWLNRHEYNLKLRPKLRLRTLTTINYHKVYTHDLKRNIGYSAERIESGLSISLHYAFSDRVSAFVFLREEFIADQLTPLMPSLGLEILPFDKKNTAILWNVSRNYHQPTLNDLYWVPGGNPDLKPEQGYTGDLGVRHKKIWSQNFTSEVKVTGFASYINNWIIWRPGDFRYWTAENLKTVFSRGVEVYLSSAYQKKDFKISGNLNYAYTKTTNQEAESDLDRSQGKQLIYIPVHNCNIFLTAEKKGFYLMYTYNFNSRRYTTSSNDDTRRNLPGYVLNHVSAGKKFRVGKAFNGDVRFKIDNLFDIQYQAVLWRAMPGRNYSVLFKITI